MVEDWWRHLAVAALHLFLWPRSRSVLTSATPRDIEDRFLAATRISPEAGPPTSRTMIAETERHIMHGLLCHYASADSIKSETWQQKFDTVITRATSCSQTTLSSFHVPALWECLPALAKQYHQPTVAQPLDRLSSLNDHAPSPRSSVRPFRGWNTTRPSWRQASINLQRV